MLIMITMSTTTAAVDFYYFYTTPPPQKKKKKKKANVRIPPTDSPGAGITEVDDRQVTTVFTVQASVHH